MDRPFKILGIQHIAIGGSDKNELANLWVNLLGFSKSHGFQSEAENVDEDILFIGQGPNKIEVDLMQPLDASKKPAVNTPPLNHIGLWVDDLKAAFAWLTQQGVRTTPGGIRVGASGFEIFFIHPKGNQEFPLSGQGVLIEMVQAPKEIIEKQGS